MGMSTHVVGFRPADDKWRKMKAIWEACDAAGTDIPQEVLEFFQHEAPGDKPGMEVQIKDSKAVRKWRDDYCQGYEVDVSKLPVGVQFIRFYNCC